MTSQRIYTVEEYRAGLVPGLAAQRTKKSSAKRANPLEKRVQAGVAREHNCITITVPIRTVSEPNSRDSRDVVARRVKRQRASVQALLLSVGKCNLEPPFVVTITRIAPKSFDSDNLGASHKAIRDQVAEWLGHDDSQRSPITWRNELRKGGVRTYGVEIKIEGGVK